MVILVKVATDLKVQQSISYLPLTLITKSVIVPSATQKAGFCTSVGLVFFLLRGGSSQADAVFCTADTGCVKYNCGVFLALPVKQWPLSCDIKLCRQWPRFCFRCEAAVEAVLCRETTMTRSYIFK